MRCPSCGEENAETARFCSSCGALLGEAPAPRGEERKVVSVLFVDLVGFTARSARADPEDVRSRLYLYHDLMKREIEAFGGTVEKFIGDAVMAVFGAPVAHEDDPTNAVDDAASQVFGLNRTDLRCMGLLFTRGPMTAGQLAEATDLSPGAMTTVLDRLEPAGLAHRLADPEDRRRVLVDITPDARDKGERLYGPIRDEGVARLKRYSDQELRLIRDFVRAGIELQERHAGRIRGLAPPHDVRTAVRNAARDMKAAAKEAKADVKARPRERRPPRSRWRGP